MSNHENPRLRDLRDRATAVGEIVSVTGETITIGGIFSPGLTIPLHPGSRVVVLTEDDLSAIGGPDPEFDL
jgi:hypothetical protein